MPEQARHSATSRGPAWLHRDPSTVHTKDFPALPARAQPDTGRHRLITDVELAALTSEMELISGGSVKEITSGGPILAQQPTRRRLRSSTFRAILSPGDRIFIAFMSICWAVCLADFWVWWLEPVHRTSVIGVVINSIVLMYVSCYPAFFVLAANHQRNVNESLEVPLVRTAMVVTRAPSEPWDVARSTLRAMLTRTSRCPTTSGSATSGRAPRSSLVRRARCDHRKPQRRGEYHRATWPRRTKCKEGNLAYFYDHWGYRNYDVVAQLDCDQRPSPTTC